MILTFKGLSYAECRRIIGFTTEQWSVFIGAYKSILFTFRGLWKISNEVFIKTVERVYLQDYAYRKETHLGIIDGLEKTPISIRKLEELTNHLFVAGEYFALKRKLSQIENFVLLFNSFTKYDLCRYWQELEV